MSEYRKLLTSAKRLVEQAAEERANVIKEGRNKAWNQEQYKTIKERYTKLGRALVDEMIRTAMKDVVETQLKAEEKRKKPYGPLNKVDGSEKLYHLQRAELLLAGQSEEDAINEYGFIASTLDDKEKNFCYIYDEVLMAKVQGPVNKVNAEEAIFKYKSDDEKEVIMAAREAWRIKEMNSTITNHFLHHIEEVTSGEGEPPTYDYNEFIDGKSQVDIDQSKNTEADNLIREAMKNETVSS